MPEQSVTSHTPESVVTILANAFTTSVERKIISMRGIYQQRGKKEYNGYWYDRLKNEDGDHTITMRVSNKMRQTLKDGRHYSFCGYIDKRAKSDSTITLTFNITDIEGERKAAFSADELKRAEIHAHRRRRGFTDISGVLKARLLKREKPEIATIYGVGGIVNNDVETAVSSVAHQYNIRTHRVNLSSPSAIQAKLTELNQQDFDLIALIRGGGSGMETFDNLTLAETASELKTPLVTAIGHAVDHSFIDDLADRSFETPTTFGNYLRQTAEQCAESMAGSKVAVMQELETMYKSQLMQYESRLADKDNEIGRKNAQLDVIKKQLAQLRTQKSSQAKTNINWSIAIGAVIVVVMAIGWVMSQAQ